MVKTVIVNVDPIDPDVSAIDEVAKGIKEGKIAAFPTETVYGLGADTFNVDAVKRIFEAKGRPLDNPLIVHIYHERQLDSIVREVPEIAKALIEKFWPGPLTLILPKKPLVPDEVTAGLPTVAVRMPAHPVAQLLIERSSTPIAAPSANLSGRPSPTDASHVIEDLLDRVDYIISAGKTPFGVESTILDLTKDKPTILRPGPITVEDLLTVLREVEISEAAKAERPYKGVAEAPGMKYRHYSPEAPLILIEGENVVDRAKSIAIKYLREGRKVGILTCDENVSKYPENCYKISLGSLSKPYTIAHNLFSSLRKFDEAGVDVIVAEGLPLKGIFFAVNNRLRKASSEIIRD